MGQTVAHARSFDVVIKGEMVAEGRTSEVFEFGSGLVVKVLRPSVPPSWAQLEASLTEAVHARGVPAPRVAGVVEVDGRPGIVFERVDGPSMWQLMLADPANMSSLVSQFLLVQREIRCSGLPEGIPDHVERLCGKIADARNLTDVERSEAADLARGLPRGAALLHGDFHPANILMGDDGPVVIDWFDATIGHPVADVVRSSILLRPSDSEGPPHLPGSTAEALGVLHREYLQGCRDVLDPAVESVWRWEAVSAASRLAERAQADEQSLVDLWRSARRTESPSVHLEVVGSEPDEVS